MVGKELSEKINNRIKEIKDKIAIGEISLLEQDLVPIFTEIRNSLNINNISSHSKAYIQACDLLNLKFEEFKRLLSSLNNEQKFYTFLTQNPNDTEIEHLFEGCWIKDFTIENLSLEFLEESKNKLCNEIRGKSVCFPDLEKVEMREEEGFTLEIPMHNFNEKMMSFYGTIKNKLPCPFNSIFEKDPSQATIFRHFVYILHLLQLGKIQYQKETNFLYIEEENFEKETEQKK